MPGKEPAKAGNRSDVEELADRELVAQEGLSRFLLRTYGLQFVSAYIGLLLSASTLRQSSLWFRNARHRTVTVTFFLTMLGLSIGLPALTGFIRRSVTRRAVYVIVFSLVVGALCGTVALTPCMVEFNRCWWIGTWMQCVFFAMVLVAANTIVELLSVDAVGNRTVSTKWLRYLRRPVTYLVTVVILWSAVSCLQLFLGATLNQVVGSAQLAALYGLMGFFIVFPEEDCQARSASFEIDGPQKGNVRLGSGNGNSTRLND